MILDIGATVADYKILNVLGQGGMGAVYRVRNTISNRIEALKVLNADLVGRTEMIDRFLAEIRTIASLDHPNITKLHTAFRIDNDLFMLMEFVDGATLSEQLKQTPLSLRQAVDYGVQILSALAYAHESGVIHRDIKPSNIVVTSDGAAKLMDFGIAKSSMMPALTQPGTALGSVHYMSPEQAQGLAVDSRSDLYSMGVVLYEIITGQRPFDGDTLFSILDQHLHASPKSPAELNPHITPQLNDIVLRALEKEPDRRFQTAACLASALRALDREQDSRRIEPGPTTSETIVPNGRVPFSERLPAAKPHSPSGRLVWLTVGSTAGISVFCASVFLISNSWKHTSAHANPAAESSRQTNSLIRSATPAVVSSVPKQPEKPPIKAVERSFTSDRPGAKPVPGADPRPVEPDVAAEELGARLLRLRAETASIQSNLDDVRKQLAEQGVGLRPEITAALSLAQSYLESADRNIKAKRYDAARHELDNAEPELAKLRAVWGR